MAVLDHSEEAQSFVYLMHRDMQNVDPETGGVGG